MGKKSGPPAPDYTGAAVATGESGKENLTQQTWANRADQNTPWGSSSWQASSAIDPSSGKPVTKWTENTTLDPRLQGALDSQISMQQGRSDLANSLMPRAAQEFGQQMDWSSLTPWASGGQAGNLQALTGAQGQSPSPVTSAQGGPNGMTTSAQGPGLRQTTSPFSFGGPRQQAIDTSRMQAPTLNTNLGANAGQIQQGLDFGGVQDVAGSGAQRARAEDAIYQSAASRLDPQWNQRQQQLETQLANQGITRNSEAYSRALADFDRGRNDAYQQANMAAITGGGAEAQRNYGMDLGLRQQQVGELGQQGAFANNAQAQQFGQGLQAGQANNQALGQGFQFGSAARDQQLAAQQAMFGQQLSQGQYGLGQQQQAFGQQQAADQAALMRQQQAFGQGQALNQSDLARQQQAFGQQLASGQFGLAQEQQAFGQEQQAGAQNFAQQQQAAQFQNQMRNQQLTEALQQRGFSLNEINAIISGQQVNAPQFAGYSQSGAAPATDFSGAASNQYGAAVDAANLRSGQFGNLLQAGGGLASAFMMSDRRVKADVRRVGKHLRGFGVYSYRYVGERARRLGVIAQDVKRFAPELVRSVNGVLQVNYAAM